MIGVLLIIVGIGVSLYIIAGVQNESMQKLLKIGEYAPEKKGAGGLTEAVESALWGITVAIYLGWSFISHDWHITWIVFVISGALSPIVSSVCKMISNKTK